MSATAPEATDDLDQRILDAAVDRFRAFGIRRTTMQDVAREARIGRATLYRRFAGRDDLVRRAVEREMARFVRRVDRELAGVADPMERFVQGFAAVMMAARTDPLLDRLMDVEPASVLPALTRDAAPILAMCRDYLVAQLRPAQARGGIRPDVDVAMVAELLVRLSQSLLVTPEGRIDAADGQALADLARTYLAPALFPAPGSRRPTSDVTRRSGDGADRWAAAPSRRERSDV